MRARQRSNKGMLTPHRLAALILCAAATLASAPDARAQSSGAPLPDIGNPASTTLSTADERRIGLMIVRGLRDAGQIVEDPEVNEYIQGVGSRLASHAHEGGQKFTFFVVKDPDINAFALPGGFIGINAGLFTATRSESELAGVLAHEIAHVTQRHIARSIQAAGRGNLASAAAVLATILIGATTGMPSDAIIGGVAAAQSLAIQQQINFTRSNESEADRVGIGILAAADFDPSGMPSFFWTMQQRAGSGRQIPELLRTHPVTTERIAETRDRAAQLPAGKGTDSLGYSLIRERLRVSLLPSDTNFRDLYRDAVSADVPSSDDHRYGRALALVAAGAPQEAVPILRDLVARRQDATQYHAALGQTLLLAGDVPGSLRVLENAQALFPRNVPVTIRLAETLMTAGRARDAHHLLLDLFNNVAPSPAQARYIAMVASTAGDTVDAYYYMSEFHLMGGELALAIDQLKLALTVPEMTDLQRNRIEARITELEEYLPKGKRSREVPDSSPRRDPEGGASKPG